MSGDIYTPYNITLTSTSCVDLGSSGYIKCTSDRRLKKNIENVDDKLKTNILDSVSKTKVKTYEFKSDAEEKEHIGLIAQDLAKNFPEIKDQLVVKDDKGMYSINTMNLIFVLWDALNETKKRIDSLDARLKKLEK
jgi:cell division protein ZapA (FtsZ GTPase activity inhibitor)